MANVIDEVESIQRFIETEIKGLKFSLLNTPKDYNINDVSIELMNTRNENVTGAHYKVMRLYQIYLIGKSKKDCIVKMQLLSDKIYQNQLIPFTGSTTHMRVDSFTISDAFITNRQVFGILGMLNIHYFNNKIQPEYEKIENVEFDMYSTQDTSTWGALEGSLTSNYEADSYTFKDIEEGKSLFNNKVINDGGLTFGDIEDGNIILSKEDE